VADTHYLSIGEVLGLLLEDFPDVTISKIRFLESQGLIEPERTPSGYRKFYDHDVDLLRAILHEQRENFLPLKVIRDRIESGGIQADATGGHGRTPPRGIRNVEVRPPAPAGPAPATEHRDSVFRRTDGGPEWADGRALIPGAPAGGDGRQASATPITASVPVTPLVPEPPVVAPVPTVAAAPPPGPAATPTVERSPAPAVPAPVPAVVQAVDTASAAPAEAPRAPAVAAPTPAQAPATTADRAETVAAVPTVAATPGARQRSATTSPMPYSRDELCAAAQISSAQLDELESYGLITARGAGRDAAYPHEVLEIATVAGRFLANGIDARHLRSWRQNADRESTLFEQRIMPLLRQRNPASRQLALDTLTELAELGGRLHKALIDAALRHHFEGT